MNAAEQPQPVVSDSFRQVIELAEESHGKFMRLVGHIQWIVRMVHASHHAPIGSHWLICQRDVCLNTAKLLQEVLNERKTV